MKFEQLPHFLEIFSNDTPSPANGACSGSDSDSPPPPDRLNNNNNRAGQKLSNCKDGETLLNCKEEDSSTSGDNNNHKDGDNRLTPGDIRISGKTYSVTDSAHLFLSILVSFKSMLIKLKSRNIYLLTLKKINFKMMVKRISIFV